MAYGNSALFDFWNPLLQFLLDFWSLGKLSRSTHILRADLSIYSFVLINCAHYDCNFRGSIELISTQIDLIVKCLIKVSSVLQADCISCLYVFIVIHCFAKYFNTWQLFPSRNKVDFVWSCCYICTIPCSFFRVL